MVFLVSVLLLGLFITIHAQVNNIVPGQMSVKLLPDNQIADLVYAANATAKFIVSFDEVPMRGSNDEGDVLFGVEIRGWHPSGGPRGYIASAFNTTTLTDFMKNYRNLVEFTFASDVFPGYSWFFRPYIVFSKFYGMSTNFVNSAASEQFHVQSSKPTS
ncbi:unnamed protein product [Didymodactylos carnosus]|uniref:Uncharacterized protein n=1 Tax=Didymodactylos carnosus TaxID=1234261 RepID=A0A813PG91_9BILA|nr:unnamed protein product [Didymodactylos carnosus]CAF0956672.1 unnamed protein product [Didymodactylos carnosus]CAF3532915.1 unnamed protein product [Didymodactylos carnosus]CAF3729841.1 unnamed protein product [Didymodactylos carnosus]